MAQPLMCRDVGANFTDMRGSWRSHPITQAVAAKLSAVDVARATKISALLESFVAATRSMDVRVCPSLRLATADDDSILVEWVFSDRRLGFAYERDERESGWYFVQRTKQGEAGPLSNLGSELPQLISRCRAQNEDWNDDEHAGRHGP